jgi:hypothetical protein
MYKTPNGPRASVLDEIRVRKGRVWAGASNARSLRPQWAALSTTSAKPAAADRPPPVKGARSHTPWGVK